MYEPKTQVTLGFLLPVMLTTNQTIIWNDYCLKTTCWKNLMRAEALYFFEVACTKAGIKVNKGRFLRAYTKLASCKEAVYKLAKCWYLENVQNLEQV